MLGINRVKTMATMVAVNRMVRSSVRVAALRKVWVHSLVTALIAEEAARVSGVAADAAYTAGLLHNLGTLGLMSAYPEEYSRMLEVTQEFGSICCKPSGICSISTTASPDATSRRTGNSPTSWPPPSPFTTMIPSKAKSASTTL